MNTGKISTRYAKALFEYALDRKQEDQLYEEMKMLSNSFISHPKLNKAIKNPTISTVEKQKLIITAAGIQVCDVFKSFLHLISKNRRETFCQFIALQYQDLYRKEKKIVTGKLISTQAISSEAQKKLKAIIAENTNKQVDFATQLDSSLIGGFILDVESMRLDASISYQLKQIKKQLLRKNKSIV